MIAAVDSAFGLECAARPQTRAAFARAHRRASGAPIVVMLFDLTDPLALDFFESYGRGRALAASAISTVFVAAFTLDDALRVLRSPKHRGDRGVLRTIEARISAQPEPVGMFWCVAFGSGAVTLSSVAHEGAGELPS